ncbi:MAG: efflux transporter outer membrane subunit [Saprospiraceae bacterium]|nr:efflux transporter outer membrane subunit [Saprospiraceae bacterium]
MKIIKYLILCLTMGIHMSCKIPMTMESPAIKSIPKQYADVLDTTDIGNIQWRNYFSDPYLVDLIDTAIQNNPELYITLQDIEIARNKIMMKDGQLLPLVSVGGGLGLEKVGRYTSSGAGDASTEITPGKKVPDNLTDINMGLAASWEADIWGKLHNAKKTAFTEYLASKEGENFVLTNLVSEIANNYYELLALDNELEIIRQSIRLQQNQLEIVKVQKQASVVSELAVKQFEAQLLSSQGLEYETLQKITETENNVNFLLGRYPVRIQRNPASLDSLFPPQVQSGIPSQLLRNRPDIRQAELELTAAKLDIKTAQLEFLPSLGIGGRLGLQSFSPAYIYKIPESLLYSLVGDLTGPIVNRKVLMAEFKNANARQIQALYNYQKTILNGFREVSNEFSNIDNLSKMYSLKFTESEVQNQSIDIANDLFKSARANYLEVLTAQREALETKLELVEIKKVQLNNVVGLYRALGGGWK